MAGAVDDTDEVVTAVGVSAEDMGEELFAFLHALELGFAPGEGGQVVIGSIHGLSGPHTEHGVIGVGPYHGQDNAGKRDENDQNQTDGGHPVFQQAFAAILKEGAGGTHARNILLVLFGGREKRVGIQMHAEGLVGAEQMCFPLSQSNSMRGSTTL